MRSKKKATNDIKGRWLVANSMKKTPPLSDLGIKIPEQPPHKLWSPESGLCTSFTLAVIERAGLNFKMLDYGSHRAASREHSDLSYIMFLTLIIYQVDTAGLIAEHLFGGRQLVFARSYSVSR